MFENVYFNKGCGNADGDKCICVHFRKDGHMDTNNNRVFLDKKQN